MTEENNSPSLKPEEKPFAAPCRKLAAAEPLSWLAAGWRDFRAAPWVSLAYGAIVVLVSFAVSFLAWKLGSYVLLLTVLSGFIFIAPLMAVGLYSVSRHLDQQRRPLFRRTWREMKRGLGQAMIHALVLMVVFLVWARAGSMVHIFMPVEEGGSWMGLIRFLAIGSLVGSIFAAISFSASAFSLPMIAERDCDMITAVITSINAVLRNKPAMLVWVMCIVVLTGLGLATGTVGLAVVIPWLGYATWHGYRATIIADEWPRQPLLAKPKSTRQN